MKSKLFLLSLIILISGCQKKSPIRSEISIEGVWQENFKQVYESLFNDPPFYVIPPETVSYSSTLTFEGGNYQILLDPPMPQGIPYGYFGQSARSNWKGTYCLSEDTIKFIDPSSGKVKQQYEFEIWSDSLKLSYAPLGYSPGDSIVCIPWGGLPWGNARGKLSGTFHRIEPEEIE